MKRVIFAIIFWFASSYITVQLTASITTEFAQQILYIVSGLIFATFLTVYVTSFFFPNKTYMIHTNLGISGNISGPDHKLPEKFSVMYSGAQNSPTITHIYDPFDQYEGFIIMFGNGAVGYSNGNIRTKIGDPDTGLKLDVRSDGTTMKIC